MPSCLETRLAIPFLFVLAMACGDDEPATEAPPAAGATPVEAAGETPAAAPVMPTVALDEAQQAKAAEIAAAARPDGTFAGDVKSDKSNALVFLHLAATSEDVNVIRAGLDALRGTWSTQARQIEGGASAIDETFVGVVLARMADERGPVQQAAYRAAAAGIMGDEPNTTLLDALVEAGKSHPTPAGRYAVINELWNASQSLRGNAERLAPFVQALDAQEPWLVSLALFRLDSLVSSYPDAGALKTKLLALTRHADPGVRGRSAIVLGNLASWRDNTAMKPEVATRLMEMLGDENPFAKAGAMKGLTAMRHAAAITALVAHLDDATPNTYDIRGFQELDGTTGSVHHDGSAWSQVRDSALYAIKVLSGEVDRSNRFDYQINWQTKDADLEAAAAAARQWHEAHRADIPSE